MVITAIKQLSQLDESCDMPSMTNAGTAERMQSLEPNGTFLVAISPVPISEAPGTQKTASRYGVGLGPPGSRHGTAESINSNRLDGTVVTLLELLVIMFINNLVT